MYLFVYNISYHNLVIHLLHIFSLHIQIFLTNKMIIFDVRPL